MPFKSDKQRRFLYSQKPEVAKKFAEHHNTGGMAGMDHVKKITEKDRYGNQISYEFENPIKPLDQTEIVKHVMSDQSPIEEIPTMIDISSAPAYDHPGEPKGSDTVPAWLTPGEFVVNKEATDMYGPIIEQMNDHGREIQANKGMKVPYYQDGGWVTEALLDRLAEIESGGNNKAVSPAGAVGMYQWLPSSAKQAGYGVKPFDPLDPKAARSATKQYLENMQKYHGFTPEETLRAYNWGPGNVINYNKGKRKDIPAEALNYPGKILGVENIEGVPVHHDMPVPTPRPRQSGESDHVKNFLDKYLNQGGPVYMQVGGYPNPNLDPVPDPNAINYRDIAQSIALEGEEDIDKPTNVVPELQDVPGNPMYEGQTTSDESGSTWWHGLLGPKGKEMVGAELTDQDKTRLEEEAVLNEKLAQDQLAEEENLIAEQTDTGQGIDAEGSDVYQENQQDIDSVESQVDDFKDAKLPKDVKKTTINEIKNKVSETTKDEDKVKASKKDVEETGKKNPEQVSKAEGFLKGILGDLFNKSELKRAAIMYVGGRLLGYNHQGSLDYSLKNYVKRVDTIAANKDAFIQKNASKYTPTSLQQFKETGDYSDLIEVAAPVNPTGQFKTFYGPGGKKVRAQSYKVGKSTYWMTADGRKVGANFTEDASSQPGTREYDERVTKDAGNYGTMLKELKNQFGSYDTKEGKRFKTELVPSVNGQNIARWAIENNVNPSLMGNIVNQAYQSALAHAENSDTKVRDITPFLNEAFVTAKVGNPELFKTEDGESVNPQKINRIGNQAILQLRAGNPERYAGLSDASVMREFFNAVRDEWASGLSKDERETYNEQANEGENGFLVFAEEKYQEISNRIVEGE